MAEQARLGTEPLWLTQYPAQGIAACRRKRPGASSRLFVRDRERVSMGVGAWLCGARGRSAQESRSGSLANPGTNGCSGFRGPPNPHRLSTMSRSEHPRWGCAQCLLPLPGGECLGCSTHQTVSPMSCAGGRHYLDGQRLMDASLVIGAGKPMKSWRPGADRGSKMTFLLSGRTR